MNRLAQVEAAASGLIFGLSLIAAIGPQNTYVLVQGVRRRHVTLVVGICGASDVAMIAVGVGGAGAALTDRPWLERGLTLAGAAFLVGYGALALRRAARSETMTVDRPMAGQTWRLALLSCVAFTWLNPGVYVDTVFLVGPVSQSRGGDRWWFAAGAMLASVAWFVALGYGARLLAGPLSRPRAWRLLNAAVAAVMVGTAVRLVATT